MCRIFIYTEELVQEPCNIGTAFTDADAHGSGWVCQLHIAYTQDTWKVI